jgi:hypothetical protein
MPWDIKLGTRVKYNEAWAAGGPRLSVEWLEGTVTHVQGSVESGGLSSGITVAFDNGKERAFPMPLLRMVIQQGGFLAAEPVKVGSMGRVIQAALELRELGIAEADIPSVGRRVWQQLKDCGKVNGRMAMPAEIEILLGILEQFPHLPAVFHEQLVQDLHVYSLWEAAALWVDYVPWPDTQHMPYPKNVELSRTLIRAGKVALKMLDPQYLASQVESSEKVAEPVVSAPAPARPMAKRGCSKCGAESLDGFACRQCGHVEWGPLVSTLLTGPGLIAAAYFWGPTIQSEFWQFVVKWVVGISGVLSLPVGCSLAFKALRIKRSFAHPTDTSSRAHGEVTSVNGVTRGLAPDRGDHTAAQGNLSGQPNESEEDRRAEQSLWISTTAENTPQAYERYLKTSKMLTFAGEARRFVDEMAKIQQSGPDAPKKTKAGADSAGPQGPLLAGKQPRVIDPRSDAQLVRTLVQLCIAYTANDREAIGRLDPEAKAIGQMLDARGGFDEMLRIFNLVPSMPGKRTLEMHWHNIGRWRG